MITILIIRGRLPSYASDLICIDSCNTDFLTLGHLVAFELLQMNLRPLTRNKSCINASFKFPITHQTLHNFRSERCDSNPAYSFSAVCIHDVNAGKSTFHLLYPPLLLGNRNSSVGIATRYGLDGLRFETRWGRGFADSIRLLALGPTQPPVQGGTKSLSVD